MRRQFVLDKRTSRLLDEMAASQSGNRSLVVRQAIQAYADLERRLDSIEEDPAFQKMMAESAKAIRENRVTPHHELVRQTRRKGRKTPRSRP